MYLARAVASKTFQAAPLVTLPVVQTVRTFTTGPKTKGANLNFNSGHFSVSQSTPEPTVEFNKGNLNSSISSSLSFEGGAQFKVNGNLNAKAGIHGKKGGVDLELNQSIAIDAEKAPTSLWEKIKSSIRGTPPEKDMEGLEAKTSVGIKAQVNGEQTQRSLSTHIAFSTSSLLTGNLDPESAKISYTANDLREGNNFTLNVSPEEIGFQTGVDEIIADRDKQEFKSYLRNKDLLHTLYADDLYNFAVQNAGMIGGDGPDVLENQEILTSHVVTQPSLKMAMNERNASTGESFTQPQTEKWAKKHEAKANATPDNSSPDNLRGAMPGGDGPDDFDIQDVIESQSASQGTVPSQPAPEVANGAKDLAPNTGKGAEIQAPNTELAPPSAQLEQGSGGHRNGRDDQSQLPPLGLDLPHALPPGKPDDDDEEKKKAAIKASGKPLVKDLYKSHGTSDPSSLKIKPR